MSLSLEGDEAAGGVCRVVRGFDVWSVSTGVGLIELQGGFFLGNREFDGTRGIGD